MKFRRILRIPMAVALALVILVLADSRSKPTADQLLGSVDRAEASYKSSGDPSGYLEAGSDLALAWDSENTLAGETLTNPWPVYSRLSLLKQVTYDLSLNEKDKGNRGDIERALDEWSNKHSHPIFVPEP